LRLIAIASPIPETPPLLSHGGYGADDPEVALVPLTTAEPLSGGVDGDDGACFPLTMAVLPSEPISDGKEAWMPRTTAVAVSGSGRVVRPNAWARFSAAVPPDGDDWGAGNAGKSLSAVLLLTGGDWNAGSACASRSAVVAVLVAAGCGVGGAWLSRSVRPLTAGMRVPTAVGAETGAFDEPGPSHAHIANAQMPTVTVKVAARAPFRKLVLRSFITLLPPLPRESSIRSLPQHRHDLL
jgi:hypothetical protein